MTAAGHSLRIGSDIITNTVSVIVSLSVENFPDP